MLIRNRTRWLALSHVLLGPPFAGMAFLGVRWIEDGRILSSASFAREGFIVAFLKLTPLFYVPGALPALLTAVLTARRIKVAGDCSLMRSAAYGALTSAAAIGLPSLYFAPALMEGYRVSLIVAATGLVGLQALLGFIGTIPVWLLTGSLRKHPRP
jgi:hypothetical protein